MHSPRIFYAVVENGNIGLRTFMSRGPYIFIAFGTFVKCLLVIVCMVYGSFVIACESQNSDSNSSQNQMIETEQLESTNQLARKSHDHQDCLEKCCSSLCSCSHASCYSIWMLVNYYDNEYKSVNDSVSSFDEHLLQPLPTRLLRPPIA